MYKYIVICNVIIISMDIKHTSKTITPTYDVWCKLTDFHDEFNLDTCKHFFMFIKNEEHLMACVYCKKSYYKYLFEVKFVHKTKSIEPHIHCWQKVKNNYICYATKKGDRENNIQYHVHCKKILQI